MPSHFSAICFNIGHLLAPLNARSIKANLRVARSLCIRIECINRNLAHNC